MTNYLSSLLPFIRDEEITYYEQLNEDVISYLISLAPIVDNSENLLKLSKLNAEQLEKATGILPTLDIEEMEKYFNQL